MKRARALSILVILSMLVLPMGSASASGPIVVTQSADVAPVSAPETSGRLIVQLEGAPLAAWWASGDAVAQGAGGRLDVNTPLAQSYLSRLDGEQAAFRRTLASAFPGATVESVNDSTGASSALAYRVVFNGVTVRLPRATENDIRRLAKLPGVRAVYPDRLFRPDMYASNPLIGSATLWTALGGQETAGAGVKIASIDGGIYALNDCFDPTGYVYPPGFPKGDTRFTNEKVIVARSYFRSFDPPTAGDAEPWPGVNGTSHGTHTSGTFGCNANTVAQYTETYSETISGVAPGAWVMSYRVFYPSHDPFYSGAAFDAEIVMAIEDAVADGADVLNNSYGGASGGNPALEPIVQALEAAVDAGAVVATSAGNEGPTWNSAYSTPAGTSDKFISAAASTTTGTIASGFLSVSGPGTPPESLQDRSFASAAFGSAWPIQTTSLYVPVRIVDPGSSSEACNDLPANSLDGVIALIQRGSCEFGTKVLNAEQAGAIAAIVYNHAAGGEGLINMGAGAEGDQVTIPSLFVQRSTGVGMEDWYDANPGTAEVTVDFVPKQVGTDPDVIASFSSRGVSFGRFIGPDVTAPGVNILSSGYGSGSGVERHMGFGQVSGTSMSSPHVAGAAALLRDLHPDWTPAQIKSALMTTAKYDGIESSSGGPASIFEMGAGRIDLSKAGDPGITVDKPDIAFGSVRAPAVSSLALATAISETVTAKDVSGAASTWNLSLTADAAIAASLGTSTLPIAAGGTAAFSLNLDIAAGTAPGDYTGTIWMDDGGAHTAHIIFWVRVTPPLSDAEVLLIDNDFSDLLSYPNYSEYFTSTLAALGVTYEYFNADLNYDNPRTIPTAAELAAYDKVIWFTGDNFYPNGSFTVATPPTTQDQNELVSYLDSGGNLIVIGQDAASTFAWNDANHVIFGAYLGAEYLQDSIFDPAGLLLPPSPSVIGAPTSPFSGMIVDLSGSGDGGINQLFVDEIQAAPVGDVAERENITPLFTAISGYALAQGTVGLSRSSEPTLENPDGNFAYRTAYLSFGLEGINNDTGYNTREDVLGRILDWMDDTPQVSLEAAPVGHPMDVVMFTATVPSGINAATPVSYRWDFGDGSSFSAGVVPNAGYIYGTPGTYQARVEMTDSYGHSAVSDPVEVTVPAAYATPASTTFPATQDTYISSWAPTTVSGDKQTMWSGHLDTLRTLLQFDTTSILSDQPVITATLHLYRTERRGAPSPGEYATYMVNKAWAEGSTTWNTPWDVPGAMPDNVNPTPDGTVSVAGVTPGWYTVDVTDMVQQWVANPASNHGVLLAEIASDDLFDGWATSSWWVEGQRPYITVDYLAP